MRFHLPGNAAAVNPGGQPTIPMHPMIAARL
jgi:hypothetical protein